MLHKNRWIFLKLAEWVDRFILKSILFTYVSISKNILNTADKHHQVQKTGN